MAWDRSLTLDFSIDSVDVVSHGLLCQRHARAAISLLSRPSAMSVRSFFSVLFISSTQAGKDQPPASPMVRVSFDNTL